MTDSLPIASDCKYMRVRPRKSTCELIVALWNVHYATADRNNTICSAFYDKRHDGRKPFALRSERNMTNVRSTDPTTCASVTEEKHIRTDRGIAERASLRRKVTSRYAPGSMTEKSRR